MTHSHMVQLFLLAIDKFTNVLVILPTKITNLNYKLFLMIGPFQFILILFVFLPTLIALIDILKNEFSGNNKMIWVLVVLFGNFLGAVLYFIIGRKQKLKN